MRRILFFLCALTVFIFITGSWQAEAQTADDPSALSLQSAIGQALEKNPLLIAAKSRLDASTERITQARSGMLPQVGFTQSFQQTTNPMWVLGAKLNQEHISPLDFAPDLLNDPDAMDNYTSRFWVAWPLFDSGQSWFGRRQAVMDNKSSDAALESTRQEVIFSAVQAYSDLLLAQKSIAVVEHAIQTARTHLKMIENRFANGLAVKSDVLRTKVHIAELEQDQVTAKSRVAVSRAALNTVMGNPTDQAVSPADTPGIGAMPEIALPEYIQKALSNRPDLNRMALQDEMARLDVKKSRAGHWPSVDLSGSYEINSEDFNDSAQNYTIGANVTVNLFSGFRLSAKTRESLNRHMEVKALRQSMLSQVRLETEQAYYDLLSADSRIASAKLSTEMAEEALRIVRDRYDSGLLSIDSLLDAELALYRANNNYCRAMCDHVQARARLALATGGLAEDFR